MGVEQRQNSRGGSAGGGQCGQGTPRRRPSEGRRLKYLCDKRQFWIYVLCVFSSSSSSTASFLPVPIKLAEYINLCFYVVSFIYSTYFSVCRTGTAP